MSNPNAFCGLLVGVVLLVCTVCGYAAEVGTVTRLEGRANVARDGDPARALQLGDAIFERDRLRTESRSSLEVTLVDGSRLSLSENTDSEVAQYVTGAEPAGLIAVTLGQMRVFVTELFSSRRDSFRVRTTTAVVGVQGTDFAVIVQELLTQLIVYAGVLITFNVDPNVVGSQVLQANQTTIVRKGQPPEPPQPVGPSAGTLGAVPAAGLAVTAGVLLTPLAVTSLSGDEDGSTMTPSVPPGVQP